ncbi:hypothetical protein I551_7723 [Mycobacterium ulcerans str. Harvey]|uniref:Uncharacterized protein n=1 Tax=Mycobacterium ulcerans str. Harvey TaxID=1299332 RepID=A0ABN0QMJ1_MYCUL|nr:hypothetical protein I551_7723 [Mycobacterium ulcerans str. Harvey]
MVLIDAGLPVPVTQIPVHQNWRLVAVLDMGWQKYQVAAEYDGDQHRFDRRQYAASSGGCASSTSWAGSSSG